MPFWGGSGGGLVRSILCYFIGMPYLGLKYTILLTWYGMVGMVGMVG